MDDTTPDNLDDSSADDPQVTMTQRELDDLIKNKTVKYTRQLKELQRKADDWDRLQEQSKSESQKQADYIAALETRVKTAELNDLKRAVAEKKSAEYGRPIPFHRLVGSTEEELVADADRFHQENPLTVTSMTRMGRSGATGIDTPMDPKAAAAAAVRKLRGQPY